ncbi:MAG: ATP-dependent RecD-like DNA helicase, partial [Oscillospiraceae bacterium]
MPQLEALEGLVGSIIFHSKESGFTVCELETGDELVTVVGEFLDLSQGEQIRVTGAWGSHPSYGRQFKAECLERILPATASAILRYLSGGAIKGIGPVLAKRIVDKFENNTLSILESDPAALSAVRGISPKKALELGEEYRRLLGVRAVMQFLSSHGVDPSTSIAVWKKWGGLAQQRITSDPYCLCAPELGVSFEQADAIAASLGLDAAAPCRVRGGVLFVLLHNLGNGHACLPLSKLLETSCALLDVGREATESALEALRDTGEVIGDTIDGQDYCYLPEQYAAESYIADRLGLMLSLAGPDRAVAPDELSALESEL